MRILGRWKDTAPAAPTLLPDGAKAFTGESSFVQSIQENGPWPWLGAEGAMYRRQPAVRSVVDFLARNIASLNLKVYERVSNTDRVELYDHPLAQLIRHPNPRYTRYRLWRDTVSSAAIYDRAYWQKVRQQGRVVAVNPVPPRYVTFQQTSNGQRPPVWEYKIGDTVVPRNDLVVFPGYTPEGGELGISPLETLRRVLEEDQAAVLHRRGTWNSAARQSGVIERPMDAPEWSDTARDRFRHDWENTYTGQAGSGRTAILEDGMSWNPSSFSPKDLLYVESRELTYREVAMAYFGPVTGRQWLETTGAGTVENHRQLYQDVFGPWLEFLQDEIELQLLADPGVASPERVYVEFNLADKLKGSFEEQAKTLVSSVGVPFAAVNEARARMNLPRLDDDAFDTPVQPLNVMYGGQPAVTVPTATPGTPRPPQEVPRAEAAGLVPPPPIPLPRGAKAVPQGPIRRRDSAAEAQTDVIRRFLVRQGKTVVSLIGATFKAFPVRDVWAAERWDAELTDELERAAIPLTMTTGSRAARQVRGVYDPEMTREWVRENARVAAETINAHTLADLEDALAAEGDPVELARDSFDRAAGGRSDQLGLSRATTLIGWSRNEAGRQSQAADGRIREKIWVVTSRKSRHSEWNGMTTEVFETFPNGGQYPGDYALGAADAAGCQCLMDLQ